MRFRYLCQKFVLMKKGLILIVLSCLSAVTMAQFPLVSIDSIQRITPQDLALDQDLSYLTGDTVEVEGIVTFDPCLYGLSSGSRIGTWIQDAAGGPFSGLHILIENGLLQGYSGTLSDLNDDTQFLDNFTVGNKVKMTGIVSNFSGNTQMILLDVPTQITGINPAPQPLVINIADLNQTDGAGGQVISRTTGEQYEGMLVEVQNVTVVNVSPSGSRFFWSLQDGGGNQVPVRDVSGYFRNDALDAHCNGFGSGTTFTPAPFTPPTLGSFLSYVRGIVLEYNGLYYIAPRTPADIGPLVAAPPVISDIRRNPTVASSTQSVDVSAKVIDPDGTISTVELYYSVGRGNTNFTKVATTAQGNDRYSGTIPPSGSDGAFVNYWLLAVDNSGDTTYFPAKNSTNRFYITLDNGIDEIRDIQFTDNQGGSSWWNGDSIPAMDIVATVTATLQPYDLGLTAVQDGQGPWSGIMLTKVPGDGLENLLRGDSIRITSARVVETFGVTYLTNVQYTLLGRGTNPPPITTLNPDSINAQLLSQAEAYESMLVRWDNAYVVDTNADFGSGGSNFGEWYINTDNQKTTGLRVDDYATDIPLGFNTDSLQNGQQLAFIQGILWYSFGNFKLIPRNQGDIDGFTTAYPKVINTFVFTGLTPPLFMDIDQVNNTITNSTPLPAGTNVSNLVPTVDFSGATVSPASGVAQDFSQPITYTVTAPVDESTRDYVVTLSVAVGIDAPNRVNAAIFPNPATSTLSIVLNEAAGQTAYITLTDMTGRIVNRLTVETGAATQHFPLSLQHVATGMYLLHIDVEGKQLTEKIQVVK